MTYRHQILSLLKAGPCALAEIRATVHIPYNTLRVTLACLKKDGLVENLERGIWSLSDAGLRELEGGNLTPHETAMLDQVHIWGQNAISQFVMSNMIGAHVASRFLNALRSKGMVKGFELTKKGLIYWQDVFVPQWEKEFQAAHDAWRERATAVFNRLAEHHQRDANPTDTWLFQMTLAAMGDDREPQLDDFDPESKIKGEGEEEETKEAA